MTAIYCGGSEYKLHFDSSSLVLSEKQIVEIAEYAIENNFEIPIRNDIDKNVSIHGNEENCLTELKKEEL